MPRRAKLAMEGERILKELKAAVPQEGEEDAGGLLARARVSSACKIYKHSTEVVVRELSRDPRRITWRRCSRGMAARRVTRRRCPSWSCSLCGC